MKLEEAPVVERQAPQSEGASLSSETARLDRMVGGTLDLKTPIPEEPQAFRFADEQPATQDATVQPEPFKLPQSQNGYAEGGYIPSVNPFGESIPSIEPLVETPTPASGNVEKSSEGGQFLTLAEKANRASLEVLNAQAQVEGYRPIQQGMTAITNALQSKWDRFKEVINAPITSETLKNGALKIADKADLAFGRSIEREKQYQKMMRDAEAAGVQIRHSVHFMHAQALKAMREDPTKAAALFLESGDLKKNTTETVVAAKVDQPETKEVSPSEKSETVQSSEQEFGRAQTMRDALLLLDGEKGEDNRAFIDSIVEAAKATGLGNRFITQALGEKFTKLEAASLLTLRNNPTLKTHMDTIGALNISDEAKNLAIEELVKNTYSRKEKPAVGQREVSEVAPEAEDEEADDVETNSTQESAFKFEDEPLEISGDAYSTMEPRRLAIEFNREYQRLNKERSTGQTSTRETYSEDRSTVEYTYSGDDGSPETGKALRGERYRQYKLMTMLDQAKDFAGKDQIEAFKDMVNGPEVAAEVGEVSVETVDPEGKEITAWEPGMRTSIKTVPLYDGKLRTVIKFERPSEDERNHQDESGPTLESRITLKA